MEQSEEVRRVALRIYDALNAKDEVAVKEFFDSGPDAINIGTARGEVVRGGDAVVATFAEQFRQAPGMQFTPGAIDSRAEGDVGWLYDEPTIVGPDGTEVVARLTGVLRRNGTSWQVVHSHLSLGVPSAG